MNCKYCNKALRKGSSLNFHKVCYPKWLYEQHTLPLLVKHNKQKASDFLDPYGLYLPPCMRKKIK